MSRYSKGASSGTMDESLDRQPSSHPSKEDEVSLQYLVEDGMADTASSNVPLNRCKDMRGQAHPLDARGENALYALCEEINQTAAKSRREAAMEKVFREEAHLKSRDAHDVIPSGKRKQGEGCEDDVQGILQAYWTKDECAVLRITLLAAGFVIGPRGQSIRDISEISGAKIKSWSETFKARRVRRIVVDGLAPKVLHALTIIKAAVARYKDFYEGNFCNRYVDPIQVIMGVEFTYSPPPRKAVPYAAGIKTKGLSIPSTVNPLREGERSSDCAPVQLNHERMNASMSSESDQSYQHAWWTAATKDDGCMSQRSSVKITQPRRHHPVYPSEEYDAHLGLFEVPCNTYEPRYREYRSPGYEQSRHLVQAPYEMFGGNDQGHLQGHPWTGVDMLRNTTVRNTIHHAMDSDDCKETPISCNERRQSRSSIWHPTGMIHDRTKSLFNCWFPDNVPSKKPVNSLHTQYSPMFEKNVKYDHMFTEFGEKCHISEEPEPLHACQQTFDSRNTPQQRSRRREDSPMHFKFEVTLDANAKEARRKLIFEE